MSISIHTRGLYTVPGTVCTHIALVLIVLCETIFDRRFFLQREKS